MADTTPTPSILSRPPGTIAPRASVIGTPTTRSPSSSLSAAASPAPSTRSPSVSVSVSASASPSAGSAGAGAEAPALSLRMSLAARMSGGLIEHDDLQIYRNIFKRRDLNGNGTLDEDELRALVKTLYQPTEEEIATVFDSIDVDKDNRVTFEEYYNATAKLSLHSPADAAEPIPEDFLKWMDDKLQKAKFVASREGSAQAEREKVELRTQFDALDIEGLGYINRTEARKLAILKLTPPDAVVNKVTDFLNPAKRSKGITEPEFVAAMHRIGGYLPGLLRAAGVVEDDWRSPRERAATLAAASPTYTYRILRVSVIEGISFPKMDILGGADPYLALQLLDPDGKVLSERKSPVHPKTRDPKFDFHVDFSSDINDDNIAADAVALRIEVWDKYSTKKDDFIGEVAWPMTDLESCNFSVWGKFEL